MGRIITLDFSLILPGEDGFFPAKIKSIIDRVRSGQNLPPVPVRSGNPYTDGFYNLDGRHRLLYKKMRRLKKSEVFFAQYPEDFMHTEVFLDISRDELRENNDNISQRWNSVIGRELSVGVRDYDEFFDLIVSKFPYMKDIRSFETYVKQNPQVLGREVIKINEKYKPKK